MLLCNLKKKPLPFKRSLIYTAYTICSRFMTIIFNIVYSQLFYRTYTLFKY